MTPTFATVLGLITKITNMGSQKIDGAPLKTYDIVSEGFSLQDSWERVRFSEETILQAETNIEMILKYFF